ncbi:MAG: hypothetical protein WD076_01335 [Parvularculaceae bacterium]
MNVTYINIRGVVDNLAWALRYYLGKDEASDLSPADIDLFGKRFREKRFMQPIYGTIEPFRSWYVDLKKRRDPSAHRIPLALVPALLNPSDAEKHRQIETQIDSLSHKALVELKRANHDGATALFSAINDLREAQRNIGTFSPIFYHDLRELPAPLYPTVAQDVGTLIRLFRATKNAVAPPANDATRLSCAQD